MFFIWATIFRLRFAGYSVLSFAHYFQAPATQAISRTVIFLAVFK